MISLDNHLQTLPRDKQIELLREYVARLAADVYEAQKVAQEYYGDLRQELDDYQWEKHYAHDPESEDRTWLTAPKKLGPP